MNLRDLRNWMKQQLAEYRTTDITEVELNEYLNRAYADFCARTGALISQQVTAIPSSTSELALPSWVVGVLSADLTTSGTKLLSSRPLNLENLFGINWQSVTGTPRFYFHLTPNVIRVVPATPSNFSDTLRYLAVVVPSSEPGAPFPLLTNDTDVPALPEPYHLALCYYALYEIASRDPLNAALARRAAMYAQIYLSMSEALRKSRGAILQDYTPPVAPIPVAQEEGRRQ